jgi:hypothetical protein
MALMYAKYPNTEPIAKAVTMVMSRQLPVCRLVQLLITLYNIFPGRLMGTRGH